MLLVLMLGIGITAHAAEAAGCPPAALEFPVHFDSGKDSPSDDRESRAVHVHLGCSGHCLATPAGEEPNFAGTAPVATPFASQTFWLAGEGPALTLRPPIS